MKFVFLTLIHCSFSIYTSTTFSIQFNQFHNNINTHIHSFNANMFTLWSMGSLSHITVTQLGIMIPMLCIGLLISVACIKSLNLLLLGENYARTMGMNIKRSRMFIFVSTALLTGTVTAFCGPGGFIGLAVPHVTRLLFNNADHRILVPGTMLTGLISMLLCDIIAKKFLLPVNCITALLGVPVILWVIAKNLRRFK